MASVIRDYLTGEEFAETSYEEFRQALAKLLVEERGYPRESLTTKIGVCVDIDGSPYTRMVDLMAKGPDGRPLLLVIFCSGEPGSYVREALAAARLHEPPVPLLITTDTKTACLIEQAGGEVLATGMRAIPYYDDLPGLAEAHPARTISPEQAKREGRILFAYSELLAGGCSRSQCACRPKPKN